MPMLGTINANANANTMKNVKLNPKTRVRNLKYKYISRDATE